jgi:aspartate/methionine/tyrosine aminotransferase
VSWHEPPAGTTVFIHLGRGDVRPITEELLLHHDTAIVPGHHFGDPECIRIGVGVETGILTEGLHRLSQVLAKVKPISS